MSERGVKIFSQQAEQLYTRGVAAARGGQKTLAASLLRQAVKLDPQHEQAWLWLSGVLDDPGDVAFCLRAVLGVNPANERAQKGLAWIERQAQQAGAPPPAPSRTLLLTTTPPDNWWSAWRARQSTWLWTLRALLLIPIVLIGATLGVRVVIQAQPLPSFIEAREAVVPTATALAIKKTAVPTAVVAAQPTDPATVRAYFDTISAERQVLQEATTAYRSTTDGGRTTVERATATKQLRDRVQQSREKLTAVVAPTEISDTHRLYLDGLAMEQEALDKMLEFYSSYDVTLANRAALRLQEARSQIATATASWDAFARQHHLTSASAGLQ
ncbi:MAG TPA: hypothetical protein VFZ66_01090 [Herpetosiphonaceae bacterium]